MDMHRKLTKDESDIIMDTLEQVHKANFPGE